MERCSVKWKSRAEVPRDVDYGLLRFLGATTVIRRSRQRGMFESQVGYRLNIFIIYVINSVTGARSSHRLKRTWKLKRRNHNLHGI